MVEPQVSLAWVGIEGDEVVIGTLNDQAKLRNLRRDPRIAVSFQAPGRNAYELDNYLVLRGTARVTEGGAAELLHELAQTYIAPGTPFPPMPDPPPGFVIRISVAKVAGNGDWRAWRRRRSRAADAPDPSLGCAWDDHVGHRRRAGVHPVHHLHRPARRRPLVGRSVRRMHRKARQTRSLAQMVATCTSARREKATPTGQGSAREARLRPGNACTRAS